MALRRQSITLASDEPTFLDDPHPGLPDDELLQLAAITLAGFFEQQENDLRPRPELPLIAEGIRFVDARGRERVRYTLRELSADVRAGRVHVRGAVDRDGLR